MAHNEGPRALTQQQIMNSVFNSNVSALRVDLEADAITISASNTSPDAGLFRVSGIQGDAGLFHISAFAGAQNFSVSGVVGDAGTFRVSSLNAALDTTNSVEKVEQQFSYYYLSAIGIFTVKSSPGLLHSVVVNTKGTATSMKIYDNTSAASGLQIANVDTTISDGSLLYDVKTTAGLTVSTAGTGGDITITYR